MSRMISFVVHGAAEPAGSKTQGMTKDGRRYFRDANPAAAKWKQLVRETASNAMGSLALIVGAPCVLTARFYFRRPANHYRTRNGRPCGELKAGAPIYMTTRPDLDKLVRAIKDGMAGVVYRNDAQVAVHRECVKLYGTPERVEIEITELEVNAAKRCGPLARLEIAMEEIEG